MSIFGGYETTTTITVSDTDKKEKTKAKKVSSIDKENRKWEDEQRLNARIHLARIMLEQIIDSKSGINRACQLEAVISWLETCIENEEEWEEKY